MSEIVAAPKADVLLEADLPSKKGIESQYSKSLESSLHSNYMHLADRSIAFPSFFFGVALGSIVGFDSDTFNLNKQYFWYDEDRMVMFYKLDSMRDGSSQVKTVIFPVVLLDDTPPSSFVSLQVVQKASEHFFGQISMEEIQRKFGEKVIVHVYRPKPNTEYSFTNKDGKTETCMSGADSPLKVMAYKQNHNVMYATGIRYDGNPLEGLTPLFVSRENFEYNPDIVDDYYPILLTEFDDLFSYFHLRVTDQNQIRFTAGFTHSISGRLQLEMATKTDLKDASLMTDFAIKSGSETHLITVGELSRGFLPRLFSSNSETYTSMILAYDVDEIRLDYPVRILKNIYVPLGWEMATEQLEPSHRTDALCEFLKHTLDRYQTTNVIEQALVGALSQQNGFPQLGSYYVDQADEQMKTFVAQADRFGSVVHVIRGNVENLDSKFALDGSIMMWTNIHEHDTYVLHVGDGQEVVRSPEGFKRINGRYFGSKFSDLTVFKSRKTTKLQDQPQKLTFKQVQEVLHKIIDPNISPGDQNVKRRLEIAVSEVFKKNAKFAGVQDIEQATTLLETSLESLGLVSSVKIDLTENLAVTKIEMMSELGEMENVEHVLTFDLLEHDLSGMVKNANEKAANQFLKPESSMRIGSSVFGESSNQRMRLASCSSP